MTRKTDLQDEATGLGISFEPRTTIKELEALIARAHRVRDAAPEASETAPVDADATNTDPAPPAATEPPPVHPGPNERFEQGLCLQCGRVNDHRHTGN